MRPGAEMGAARKMNKKNDKATEHGFWRNKTPCWRMRGCIWTAREACKAYRNPERPCWEQETLCLELFGIDTCEECEVYRLYCSDDEEDEDG